MVELKDLLPQRTEFKINKKTYALRPLTLNDRMWCKDKFGDSFEKVLEQSLKDIDYSKLVFMAYHQLEDKKDFLASKEEIIDDEGMKKETMVTGPEKFSSEISSLSEIMDLVTSFFGCAGVEKEKTEKIIKEEFDGVIKKKGSK